MRRQIKEITDSHHKVDEENSILRSKIIELEKSISEITHKHKSEIAVYKNDHNELNSKCQGQKNTILDLQEKLKELTSLSSFEKQKFNENLSKVNQKYEKSEMSQIELKKFKDDLEAENLRLSSQNHKLSTDVQNLEANVRKLTKENSRLFKQNSELLKPVEHHKEAGIFYHFPYINLENELSIKDLLDQLNENKKRLSKTQEQRDKYQALLDRINE